MTCLFADVIPSFEEFWIVLSGMAMFAMCVATVGLWFQGRKTKQVDINPQPFIMKFAEEFVSKKEFEKQADAINQVHRDIFSKIGGVERGMITRLDTKLDDMTKSAEEGREKLHARINEVLSSVSELRGEMKRIGK